MDNPFYYGPIYGLTLTIVVYSLFNLLQRKFRWVHPLFFTSVTIIIFVVCTDSLAYYEVGGEWITFLLGPATIALGVPLYKNLQRIRCQFKPILIGVIAGSITGIVSAGVVLVAFQASEELVFSMLPKSVTTPVAIEISKQLGGLPEITAVFTVLAGLLGSLFGPQLLKKIGIKRKTALGVALGTGSHGIGTDRMIRESEWSGAVSGLSMGLAAIVTSLFMIPLYFWLS